MYHKGLIMEIKEDYCLVMEDTGNIVRIYKKGNMQVGQQIYFLNEDIYNEKIQDKKMVNFMQKPFTKVVLTALTVILLFVTLHFSEVLKPVDAYAMVSFDGNKSLQLEIDNKHKIKDVITYDNTINEEKLKQLKGKKLENIKKQLKELLNTNQDSYLIGYAFYDENDIDDKEELIHIINNLIDDEDLLFIQGKTEDIENAKSLNCNLGLYVAKQKKEEDIEDLYDDISYDELQTFIQQHPELLNNEDFKELLEDEKEEYEDYENDEENDNLENDHEQTDDDNEESEEDDVEEDEN